MTKVKTTKQAKELPLAHQNGGGNSNFAPKISLDSSTERPLQPSEARKLFSASPEETLQLTELEFRDLLRALAKSSGCMAELARRLEVSGQWIGDIVSGKKRPGPKLLSALGAEAITVYRVPVIPISRGEEG